MKSKNSRSRRAGVPVGATLRFATAAIVGLAMSAGTAWADGPNVLIRSSAPATLSSHPSTHHRVERDPATGQSSDWAADWAMPAGTRIRSDLDGPYGTTLRVLDVQPACSGGVQGGNAVRIAIYQPNGGPRIGWVDYLHLSDVAVRPGQTVYRDTVLGKVGAFSPSDCWDGTHVHVEGFNDHQYSCYYAPSAVAAAQPIGRIGGADVRSSPAPCP